MNRRILDFVMGGSDSGVPSGLGVWRSSILPGGVDDGTFRRPLLLPGHSLAINPPHKAAKTNHLLV